ncbi:dephospho-CoA kinase [Mycoplasma sp. 48589B]
MIAIVGRIASGKTTFLSACKQLGYSTFNCDEYVSYLYSSDQEFISLIEQKIGPFLIENGAISKKKIKVWMMQDFSSFQKLQKEVFLAIKNHLLQHKYDFVEIPVLANDFVDFSELFTCIFHMQIDEFTRSKFKLLKGVDNSIIQFLDNLNAYNWELNDFFKNKRVVHISLDKRDNLEKISKLIQETSELL